LRDRCLKKSDGSARLGWLGPEKMNGEQVETLNSVCQHESGIDISER
jgi:hypothetical protein